MDYLIEIGTSIVKYTVKSVGRRIGYFIAYKTIVEDLKTQLEGLKHARERVDHSVAEARNNNGIIEGNVENWQSKASSVTTEAEKLLPTDEDQAETCFSRGCFSRLIKRYKISKEAKITVDVVATTIEQSKDLGKVYYRLPPSNSFKIKGYEQFETRAHVFEEIMEALKDVNVRTIGVWGMGGVGKTMLVQAIARQAKSENLFSCFVFTTISQTPNRRSIQEEVGKPLGLEPEENTVALGAKRLRDRLRREKKILIIIDDIWSNLDLEDIGIVLDEDQNECKILLTSRSQDVLCNDMGAERSFNIGVLSQFEATNLFDQIVGDPAKEHRFQKVKKKILQKCAGLPLAISIVAKALKGKSISIWEDALQELRASNPVNIKGVEKEVYSVIRWSYDFLQSEEAKSLLLLCSLHQDDEEISVETLLMYGMGLRFFHGIRKLKDARNRVFNLVETLKYSSLLLDGSQDNNVRMHDVIRDVILSIASKDRQMHFIRNTEEFSGRINDNELEDSTAILLHFNRETSNLLPERLNDDELEDSTAISTCLSGDTSNLLPERLSCPKLQLFSLDQFGTKLLEIPNKFFEVAKDLQVLELVGVDVNVSRLSSICLLNNLKTLTCSYSSLGDIACIGELKCLEFLDLSHSNVKAVPKELGKLTRLLSLNLDYCVNLEVIESDVILNFRQLEEISMEGSSFTQWASVREDSRENWGNASLTELKQARNLTTLKLDVREADNLLPDDLFNDKLEKFEIRATSSSNQNYSSHLLSRSLILHEVNDSLLERRCLKPFIKRAENVHISVGNVTNSVVGQLGDEGCLKVLTLSNDHTVRYVIDTYGSSNMSAFQNLEELYLENLEKLETICNGCDLSVEKLRVIVVRQCHSLKNLFPLSSSFRRLEKLEVFDCEALEDIFMNIKDSDEVIEFPLLQSVEFVCIPKLKEFSVGSPATRKRDDDRLPLFHHKVAFPTLKKLKLEALDSMKMIWPEDDHELVSSNYFCKLEELSIFSCEKLTRLCSSTMLRGLRGLTDVNVMSCDMMEGVIEIRNPKVGEERFETTIRSLILTGLQKLEHLLSCKEQCAHLGSSVTFSKLEKLEVSECSSLKSLFPASVAKALLNLEFFRVKNCGQLREIIVEEEGTTEIVPKFAFPRLSSLYLSELPELESLYRKLHCSEWPSLIEFTLESCGKVKILASQLSIFEGNTVYSSAPFIFMDTVTFPRLKTMNLISLDRLEMIWQCDQELIFADSFGQLQDICIRHCKALIKVFPLDCLRNLGSLTELVIAYCAEVEEVFEMRRLTIAETSCERVISNIVSIRILSLPKLKHVWKYKNQCDPQSGRPVFISPKLKKVVVFDCPSLETFFPASVAKELPELESLQLERCGRIREVIAKEEGGTEIIPKFAFPHLTDLNLSNLPELECLYPGLHSSNWPSLSMLTLKNCVKQKILSNTPLFMMETVTIPKLSIISLESLDVFDSIDNIVRVDRLSNLKGFLFPSSKSFEHLTLLAVSRCGFTVRLFAPSTARSLPQLTTLSITECKSMTQVMGDDLPEEKGEIVFSKLKTLVLACLPTLFCFHSGHCGLLFPSLENLVVLQCPEMRSFSSEAITPKLKGVITRTRRIDRILCLERRVGGSFCISDDLERVKPVEERWDGDINSTLQNLRYSSVKNAETDIHGSEDGGDEEDEA